MGEDSDGSWDEHKDAIFSKLVGRCPEAMIQVGSVTTKCLFDTGSEISTVTESLFRKSLEPNGKTIENISNWMKIKAANGLEIPYLGCIEVNMTVFGIEFSKLGMLVVKDPVDFTTQSKKQQTPVLIGSNVLRRMHDQLDADQISLLSQTGEGKEMIRVLSLYGNVDINNRDSSNDAGCEGYVRVLRGHPVKIPGRSFKTVLGTGKIQRGEYCAMVERIHVVDASLPRDLMVMRSYTNVKHGRVPVCLVNLGEEDIWLPPKTRLAEIHSVDELDKELFKANPIQTINNEIVIGNPESDLPEFKEGDSEEFSPTYWPKGLPEPKLELTPSQLYKVRELLYKHRNVISKGDHDMGYTTLVKHKIPVTDDVPIRLPHRRIPPNLQSEVKQIIQNWLTQKIIRPSSSSYASQCVLVRKKTGGLRVCIDFRALNKKTRKDAYPLPRVDETLEALHGSKYFSSLDLAQGYLQCVMDEKDISKTAFRVGSGGLYEFVRMPFGLCNAPAT